jgi:hypothetical protein
MDCGFIELNVWSLHRWARMLKHRLPFIICQPRKTKSVFCFCFQQSNGSLHFHFLFAANKWKLTISISSIFCLKNSRNMEIDTLRHQMENGSQAVFLNLFIICSSCKRKFVVCPFVDKEKKRKLSDCNGQHRLSHLWSLSLAGFCELDQQVQFK